MIYADSTIEELLNLIKLKLIKLERDGVQHQFEMPDVPGPDGPSP
jgi:hypothetical protein